VIPLVSYVLRRNQSITCFFDYCIAKIIWECISELLNLRLGQDFESVAHFWLANKRHKVTNVVSSAILWSI
jgi:hypothetical protein